MSREVGLDRLVEAVGRDLQAGITAADAAGVASGDDSPFAVTSVELVVPFEATMGKPDEETTLLLGVGDGDGRLTLRYRPVPAEELRRMVAEPPELTDPGSDRLVAAIRPLTAQAARRLREAGFDSVAAVADADGRELKRLLRGTDIDPGLVVTVAALAALGADPVTAELLARSGVGPRTLVEAGPGEAFDRLRRATERFPGRVPSEYRVDYAAVDALVAAADR